jgi:hypothetical protein
MTTEKTVGQLVDMMKSVLEAMMRDIFTVQDQGERLLNLLLDQGVVAQREGRKMVTAWLSATRKAGDEYAGMVRRYIKKFGEYLSGDPSSKPSGKKTK